MHGISTHAVDYYFAFDPEYIDGLHNNYTRVTVCMPQIGKVPIPWEFLRRQRNMVSLTIIGCTVWENIGPAAGQPLPVFAKVKRLHLDACSQAVVALMARTAPNVEHIEIIRSMPVVNLVNGHVKTISLRECTGLFAFHANCKMLTTIYVPDALPILKIITLRHCYRLQRIPNHFRYCNTLTRIVLRHCFNLQSIQNRRDGITQLKYIEIVDCPLLCDLPSIHPDTAPTCEVTVKECPLLTMATVPVSWRLIGDTSEIKIGNWTAFAGGKFKAALQLRFDTDIANWNRRRHATAGADVNALITSLLLGLQHTGVIPTDYRFDDARVDPEVVEEALEYMRVQDLHFSQAEETESDESDAASSDESDGDRELDDDMFTHLLL